MFILTVTKNIPVENKPVIFCLFIHIDKFLLLKELSVSALKNP